LVLNLKKYTDNLSKKQCFSAFMILLVAVFSSSCGKTQAPPPPKSRPELINDTLNVLKDHEHKIALKKIERLRELEPTNVFLANLEILERNNTIVTEAQAQIDKCDLKKALAIINDGIKKYGRHKDLMNASRKLSIATKLEELLTRIKKPRDSDQLRKSALQLKKVSEKYKPAKGFKDIAEKQLVKAEKMEKWENQEAIVCFLTYLDGCIDRKDLDVDVLFAILEIEAPNSKSLLVYQDHLQGNSELPLKTFISNDEILRKQIALELQKDKKEKIDEKEKIDKESLLKKDTNKKKKGWWDKFIE